MTGEISDSGGGSGRHDSASGGSDVSNGRYAKQIRFAPVGPEGQERIARATVAIVGCGALGALAAEQLVRAGVGHVKIIDRDFVELSNLQRQVLFTEDDAARGIPKAAAAAEALERINSEVEITPCVRDITRDTCRELVGDDIDLVLDGTDNLETRYLLNEHCLDQQIPWVYGGCVGSQGQATLFAPPSTPCLRCLFPDLPGIGETETCDTAGVLAPAAHLVASLQVALALRAIVDSPEQAGGRLMVVDVWEGSMRTVRLPANDGCPTCRGNDRPFLSGLRGPGVTVLCGRNAVQVTPEQSDNGAFDLSEIANRLASIANTQSNRFLVRADLFAEPSITLTVFRDRRVVVQGTDDPAVARSLVAKHLGM